MRTLLLYIGEDGESHCACVIHDGSFDPTDPVNVAWKDELQSWCDDNIHFAVHGIADDLADTTAIFDENGNEIGKQYIQR